MENFDFIYLENWMFFLKKYIEEKTLLEICFYGSHDSNTSTLDSVLDSYGIC